MVEASHVSWPSQIYKVKKEVLWVVFKICGEFAVVLELKDSNLQLSRANFQKMPGKGHLC